MPKLTRHYSSVFFGFFMIMALLHGCYRLAGLWLDFSTPQITAKIQLVGFLYDLATSVGFALILALLHQTTFMFRVFAFSLVVGSAITLLANLQFQAFFSKQLSPSELSQVISLVQMPSLLDKVWWFFPLFAAFFYFGGRPLWRWTEALFGKSKWYMVVLAAIAVIIAQGVANGKRVYGYNEHIYQSNVFQLLIKKPLKKMSRASMKFEVERFKNVLEGDRAWDTNPWVTDMVASDRKRIFKKPLTQKPNIVIISLESFMALEAKRGLWHKTDFTGTANAGTQVTSQKKASQSEFHKSNFRSKMPQLDKILANSVTVKGFFANGHQTVRGDFATLCSLWPNLGEGMVYLNYPHNKYRCLPKYLGDMGYQNFWLSGFYKSFHNKSDFLAKNGITELYDIESFPSETERTGDGISDRELFKKLLQLGDQKSKPFFASVITYSTHFPFVLPDGFQRKHKNKHPYQDCVEYSDQMLGEFFEKARKKKWFSNTVFILVGDHTMMWPYKKRLNLPEKALASNLVVFGIYMPEYLKRSKINTIASHVDILPTVLDLLNYNGKIITTGLSIFNPNRKNLTTPFAWGSNIGFHHQNAIYINFERNKFKFNLTDKGSVLERSYDGGKDKVWKKIDDIRYVIEYGLTNNSFSDHFFQTLSK